MLNILSLKFVNSSLKATLADFALSIMLICDCNHSNACSKIFAISLMYKTSSPSSINGFVYRYYWHNKIHQYRFSLQSSVTNSVLAKIIFKYQKTLICYKKTSQ